MKLESLLLAPLIIPFVSATVFTVGVGKDETTGKKGIGFDPSVIFPVAGDEIVFEFRSGQHSVVESSYNNPCTPANGGFDTGVQTVPDSTPVDADGLPTVTLTVTDNTKPMWFFDQAGGKCQQGGVLAVNPAGSETPGGFKENAANQPATPSSTNGSGSSEVASSNPSGTSGSSSVTATATTPASTSEENAAGVNNSVSFLGIGTATALLSMILS